MPWYRGWIGAAIIAVLSGCTTTTDVSNGTSREPCRLRANTLAPLASPTSFKNEYSYPERHTAQSFRWSRQGCEWTILIPNLPDAFAGIVFRKPFDLSDDHESKWLTFRLKPAYMADHLTVALSDDPQGVSHHVLGNALRNYEVGVQGDWGFYSICIDEFDRTGLETESIGAPLDFAHVRGIRIARLSADGPPAEVVLRSLRFQGDSLFVPQQFAEAN